MHSSLGADDELYLLLTFASLWHGAIMMDPCIKGAILQVAGDQSLTCLLPHLASSKCHATWLHSRQSTLGRLHC